MYKYTFGVGSCINVKTPKVDSLDDYYGNTKITEIKNDLLPEEKRRNLLNFNKLYTI